MSLHAFMCPYSMCYVHMLIRIVIMVSFVLTHIIRYSCLARVVWLQCVICLLLVIVLSIATIIAIIDSFGYVHVYLITWVGVLSAVF